MIKSFLKKNKTNLTKSEINSFLHDGYVILRKPISFWSNQGIDLNYIRKRCDQLLQNEGDLAGQDGKRNKGKKFGEKGANRLKNLLAKDDCFRKLITIPDILHIASKILNDNFKLSSIDMREPIKDTGWQGLHLDWKQRDASSSSFFQCTAFILLDEVNNKNGAIRIIPKSHQELVNIKSVSDNFEKRSIEDHEIIEDCDLKYAKLLTGSIGDIILLNVNTFHGGTKNINGDRRRLIHLNYRHATLPLNIDQYEFIPKHMHKNFNNFEVFLIALYKKPYFRKLKIYVINKCVVLYTKLIK